MVESPSPLLVIVSLSSARQDRQDRAYPREVQSSNSLPSAYAFLFQVHDVGHSAVEHRKVYMGRGSVGLFVKVRPSER